MSYVCLGLLLRPASPMRLAPVAGQPLLWRGAYHVHTTRSDGSGTQEEVAAAAAAAGLQFVILTDHGDGTRAPDPPRYVDGVLLIDGVEISTDAGHYVAIGMAQAPFPLGGDAEGVADDVRRLGGIGLIAHPDSPRPALAWHDPSVPADGFEWLNADSVWRGASRGNLLLRLATYPFNRGGSLAALAEYPERLFEQYDQPSLPLRTLALPAVDAHARVGWRRDADPLEGGRTVARLPSYRAMFDTFGIVVPWRSSAPSGEAQQDASAVISLIRAEEAYGALFSQAPTPYLAFEATPLGSTQTPRRPDRHVVAGAAKLRVRTNGTTAATIRIRRNGRPWRELPGETGETDLDAGASPGVYRAELWLPGRRGWAHLPAAVSQVIAHNLIPPRDSGLHFPPTQPVAVTDWHGEHDARSSVAIAAPGNFVANATLALADGARVSQFAALVADLAPPPPQARALSVVMRANKPMRISVQLREPRPGEGLRWRRSMYLEYGARVGYFPLSEFHPIAPASGQAPLDRLHALLFVVDTVNARPGDSVAVTIESLAWILDR